VDQHQRQLIDNALSGDAAACGELYDTNARWIKVYFLRSGFSQTDADDLVQETFIRAFRSLGTFDTVRGTFRSWVSAIARNVTRKRWSARKKPEDFDPELAEYILADTDNPGASAELREEIDAVRHCVHSLPADLRRVVGLRYVSGMTTRGVAAETGLAEATVRLRIENARRRIEKCLRAKGVKE